MMDHRTVSLADQVFDRLEGDILSGKYSRGEVLTETGLGADLGVSRTPIREALHRLEQEHIIEVSGKGIEVLGISAEDLEDIYAIRLAIEGHSAAACAKRITEGELETLKEALDLQEFYAQKQDADRIKYQDSRFHELVYRFSGSLIYYDTLLPLHKKAQKYRKVSVENVSRAASSVAEHREIYEAIAEKNAEKAEEAMTRHVKNAMNHILQGRKEKWD
ncbi:MAG: GntR family transcriptional regulator [Clostridia bacterium]|nr:GntR family transcriptional regulator [Clostridia bacterium]